MDPSLYPRCVPSKNFNEINELADFQSLTLSAFADFAWHRTEIPNEIKDLCRRRKQTPVAQHYNAVKRGSSTLEGGGVDLMPGQQAVKISPISPGQFGRLGNVAIGDFQQLDQIVPFKLATCLLQREHFRALARQCVLHERRGYQSRRAEHNALFNHVL
jgi:hypothetical protein